MIDPEYDQSVAGSMESILRMASECLEYTNGDPRRATATMWKLLEEAKERKQSNVDFGPLMCALAVQRVITDQLPLEPS